jgi:hypothetical protein
LVGHRIGAQWASRRPSIQARTPLRTRLAAVAAASVLLVLAGPLPVAGSGLPGTEPGVLTVGSAAAVAPATESIVVPDAVKAAHRPKVVIVVGPTGGVTATYRDRARRLAAVARAYGATVVQVYSPRATWARVRAAAEGANVLIYLGHGNGYPSPYGSYTPLRRNGMGLNASLAGSDRNTRYYGAAYMAQLRLAPGAVVILNHLCYASGNNEWRKGNPTRSVAMIRADGYASGFLRAGASAVFAAGVDNPAYILRALFGNARTVRSIFWSARAATRTWAIAFASRWTQGAGVLLDPYAPRRYYRSVVGDLDGYVSAWGDPASWDPSAVDDSTGTGDGTSGTGSATTGDASAGTGGSASSGDGSTGTVATLPSATTGDLTTGAAPVP